METPHENTIWVIVTIKSYLQNGDKKNMTLMKRLKNETELNFMQE